MFGIPLKRRDPKTRFRELFLIDAQQTGHLCPAPSHHHFASRTDVFAADPANTVPASGHPRTQCSTGLADRGMNVLWSSSSVGSMRITLAPTGKSSHISSLSSPRDVLHCGPIELRRRTGLRIALLASFAHHRTFVRSRKKVPSPRSFSEIIGIPIDDLDAPILMAPTQFPEMFASAPGIILFYEDQPVEGSIIPPAVRASGGSHYEAPAIVLVGLGMPFSESLNDAALFQRTRPNRRVAIPRHDS